MTKKFVENHEKKYWHVPKFGLLPLVGLTFFGLLSYFNFFLLDWKWFDISVAKSFVFSDLTIIYPYVFEYFFIIAAVVSFVALIKGGYGNLKSFIEERLIVGLIAGLIAGLIGGLIAGLIWGLIWGLIVGLIWGLIAGLIWGLIGGLIAGLIAGLIEEF